MVGGREAYAGITGIAVFAARALKRIDSPYAILLTGTPLENKLEFDGIASRTEVNVTARRAAGDFASCMRDLVDIHYPEAGRIRVVLDNLSAHTPAALRQPLLASEARRILRRLGCAASASTAASRAATTRSSRSPPARTDETPAVLLASIGCSRPNRRASKWPRPIQSQSPKSYNPCAEPLIVVIVSERYSTKARDAGFDEPPAGRTA